MVNFVQKLLYSCKVFFSDKSCCIRAKVVEFWQKWLNSGKSGFTLAKRLYSNKTGFIRAKLLYTGKSGCIPSNLLYSSKVADFGQK